jgi:hypothetical protein
MGSRFIQILQKDIVTNPEEWKHAGPGKFIQLSNKAKNVYSVLSVIAFSAAGNAEGRVVKNFGKLGKGWFWTSHAILQQLTGSCQKTVQRAIKELEDAGFIGYHPAKKNGHQCFFKIKRIYYNGQEDFRVTSPRQKSVEDDDPVSPQQYTTERKKMKNKGKMQKREVELDIPYSEEGVLFQRGENTHNDNGSPVDKNGKTVDDFSFGFAEMHMQNGDEEAFLKTVIEFNIENHLVPKYREKLAELKNR